MTALWIGLVVLGALGALACVLVMFQRSALLTGAAYADTFRHPATRSPKLYDPPTPVTVTLTRTPHEVVLQTEAGPVVARIWDGVAGGGIRVHAYVVELRAVYDADAAALEQQLNSQASSP